MQANSAEGQKKQSIEGEGRERNLTSRVVTAIHIKERGAPA